MAKAGTFQKGSDDRRNTKGRPPKPDLRTTLENLPENIKRELLTCKLTGVPVGVNEFAAISLACAVGEGDVGAIKYLNDHIHGKPKEHIEIEESSRMVVVEEIISAADNHDAA